jgi:hypothetical protein
MNDMSKTAQNSPKQPLSLLYEVPAYIRTKSQAATGQNFGGASVIFQG